MCVSRLGHKSTIRLTRKIWICMPQSVQSQGLLDTFIPHFSTHSTVCKTGYCLIALIRSHTARTPASALLVAAVAKDPPASVAERALCHLPLIPSAFCATASAFVPALSLWPLPCSAPTHRGSYHMGSSNRVPAHA